MSREKTGCPENDNHPNGCQLHNLHCQAPRCFTKKPESKQQESDFNEHKFTNAFGQGFVPAINYFRDLKSVYDDLKKENERLHKEWEEFNIKCGMYSLEIDEVKKEITALAEKNTDLSIKLQRTVSAAHSALLLMSAWLGIPDKKRRAYIEEQMENVRYCAEHDLRHVDESQRNATLAEKLERYQRALEELESQRDVLIKNLTDRSAENKDRLIKRFNQEIEKILGGWE